MESYTYDRGTYFLILGRVLTCIMLCVVILRLYSRSVLTRSIGSDDFAISISACINIFDLVDDTIWVRNGLGRHESLLNQGQLSQVKKWFAIGWTIAFISYFFIRASVMLFVLRLLPPGKRWQTRIILIAFFLNFAITIIATVTYGVHCIPFQAAWKSIPNSHCQSDQDLVITQWVNGKAPDTVLVLACIIDITTAIIPQFLLWKVKMRESTKLSLNIIFALGLITAAMSIGRVASTNYGTVTTDQSWRDMTSKTFGLVEEKCGIIFASAPALRQFVAYFSRRHTIFPTRDRQYPNEDFRRFRRRVNLRDLLWFRTPSLVEGRVLKPQRLFYPLSNQASDSETLVDQTEKKEAEKAAEKSMLDVMRGKLKNIVSDSDAATDSRKTGTSSSATSTGGTLKTRLWNWESSNPRNEVDQFGTRSSGEHVHGRLKPPAESEHGKHTIQIEHDFDVRSEQSNSRKLLTEPASVYHHHKLGMQDNPDRQ